ncbi:hypothetical protein BDW71DRAFT_180518, partial [Aspergillus fruticulosus]
MGRSAFKTISNGCGALTGHFSASSLACMEVYCEHETKSLDYGTVQPECTEQILLVTVSPHM